VRDRVTGVQDLAPCIHDSGSLAAAVQAMDVVVTTDNEVAHLAGALNTPGLVLLRHNPHWIYGKHRDATPSYATLRLIRQPEAGDWRTPCKEAERLIAAWAATRLRQGA
jgi:ADP-heptose:LPS heptosyltransferase